MMVILMNIAMWSLQRYHFNGCQLLIEVVQGYLRVGSLVSLCSEEVK